MPGIPGVSSNHPEFEAAAAAWLIESRMPLPAGLRLEVVDPVPVFEDAREIFPQSEVEIRAGDPLGWVHLTWRHAPAVARIEATRPRGPGLPEAGKPPPTWTCCCAASSW